QNITHEFCSETFSTISGNSGRMSLLALAAARRRFPAVRGTEIDRQGSALSLHRHYLDRTAGFAEVLRLHLEAPKAVERALEDLLSQREGLFGRFSFRVAKRSRLDFPSCCSRAYVSPPARGHEPDSPFRPDPCCRCRGLFAPHRHRRGRDAKTGSGPYGPSS